MKRRKRVFYRGGIEITKREILASIAIAAVMLLIGLVLSNKISDWLLDRNAAYNKAVKITDAEIFRYGMRTDVGNAFVYGDYIAVDPVTYPEIGGGYMYIEKVKERYTMHTRTVTRDKKTYTETYYTWDRVGSEEKHCKQVSFLGVVFDAVKIQTPNTEHITTIRESHNIRYVYNGTEAEHTGTIFTRLEGNTISDKSPFYERDIESTIEHLESGWQLWLFWIAWLILIGACLYGFFYLENEWLE